MPSTPLQAAACGCWPLVPAIDGLIDCFGATGRCYSREHFDTPEKLARQIRILTSIAEWSATGMGNVREIALRYSVTNMVDRYLDLYSKLLATEL